ncbi:hypothetical protein VC83_09620 [Pseudogymnoascus destructans]|uniref:Uncharacterized protein n=1 Tax=Pseudogymnoascus destructans TaxID=655981 RepID=A0A2P6FGJ9_9PEZI|nr:uncharacterized protein VC83_09620 [Pseudogymnoascus destructans]PQM43493.1 hypothetical protein VC83_09620 [Pseudogymnoascus destructans]
MKVCRQQNPHLLTSSHFIKPVRIHGTSPMLIFFFAHLQHRNTPLHPYLPVLAKKRIRLLNHKNRPLTQPPPSCAISPAQTPTQRSSVP